MDFSKEALEQAEKLGGKISVTSKVKIKNQEDLSAAYTPGVAAVSSEVAGDVSKAYRLTIKGNSVAVVSDGSSVLGLGDIGPEAALPVIEGKCILFKEFAGIDAYPIVLKTKNVAEIVQVVKAISPGFAGVNLEDISAPRCFEIEEALQDIGIPVFHDDQHGTAIVVLAALTNALKVVDKKMEGIKVVILGAGAAGIAISKIINPGKLVLVDSKGPITAERADANPYKKEVVSLNNYFNAGSLEKAFEGADVFIGVSGKGKIESSLVKMMSKDPIIFALSNPNPEIMPKEAREAGAFIVATGRSDLPNQINNVLAFPGVYRGALDNRVKKINMKIKLKAASAIAKLVERPKAEQILPSPFDKRVVEAISAVVAD